MAINNNKLLHNIDQPDLHFINLALPDCSIDRLASCALSSYGLSGDYTMDQTTVALLNAIKFMLRESRYGLNPELYDVCHLC